jgi:MFS family permease
LSVPGTLLAKAILPSTSIAIGALIWSIAATCQAAAFTPGALFVCRLFVGVGEALFGQAMALYFTYWYLPDELSKRIGLFISAGSVAGAYAPLPFIPAHQR